MSPCSHTFSRKDHLDTLSKAYAKSRGDILQVTAEARNDLGTRI